MSWMKWMIGMNYWLIEVMKCMQYIDGTDDWMNELMNELMIEWTHQWIEE